MASAFMAFLWKEGVMKASRLAGQGGGGGGGEGGCFSSENVYLCPFLKGHFGLSSHSTRLVDVWW